MPEQNNPSSSAHQRAVRVFISSTFCDMQAEREELVKFVFPELRRRCRQRGVDFVDVDLRWGVTEEQKAEGRVLPICLAEIDRCRPYFIGLLGERYGWVPQQIDASLLQTQPWLHEHRERSVTELEILHGVLNNPQMQGFAFFYFRDFHYSQQVEEALARQPGYTPEPEAARLKLGAFKERIRTSSYPVHEGYADIKTVGQLVIEDLWSVIDKRFPEATTPTALERERLEHEAFAEARRKLYLGRPEYFKRLDEHVQAEGPPLVVLGDSGSGKSALLANWAQKYRTEHPDEFMVLHFIGSTADSADYAQVLRRIMAEIQERYEPSGTQKIQDLSLAAGARREGDIPSDPKKVVEQFPLWLAKAAARGKFILILDGLNQLADRDNAPDLGWLPEYFPPNIRVILSTLPGRSLETLSRRNLPTLNVAPFTAEECRQFITRYLSQYTKELPPEQSEKIAEARQSSNPLYLRVLLEELRIYGDHATLAQRIDHYLSAPTARELYGKVLKRYEADYDRERPGLVKEAMSLIWASRRGLAESELLELLGKEGAPLPRAYWSPLYLAAEEALVNRGGLLGFFHDFLRAAVEERYLKTPEQQQNAHLRLADFFEKRELDERKADELPWQLCEAAEWKRLKDCITDLEVFCLMMDLDKKYEVLGYWLAMGDRFAMAKSYRESLELFEKTSPAPPILAHRYDRVASFLQTTAHYHEAEPLYRRALAISENTFGKNHSDTASILNNLAVLLAGKGNFDEAEPLYRRALAIRENTLGKNHPDTAQSLNNLAVLLYAKGSYDKAEPLLKRALAIYENTLGKDHPDTAQSLNNLAELLRAKRSYDEAEPLYHRALAIRENTLGKNHPDTAQSLNSLAELLYAKRSYDEAEPLLKRALAIREKIFGKGHPFTAQSLNNLALLLKTTGNYDEAEPLNRRALAIQEVTLGKDHLETATTLNNLAVLLEAKSNYDEAEPLYRRALATFINVMGKNHPHAITVSKNLQMLAKSRSRAKTDIASVSTSSGMWGKIKKLFK